MPDGSTAVKRAPLARQRYVILAGLIGLAALGWAVILWQTAMMDNDDMGLTMGMAAPLFIAVWVAMMAAMMFPAAAPMILTFEQIQTTRQQRGQAFVAPWLFSGAYLAVWIAAGVVAYFVARLAEEAAMESMWLMDNAARIGGLALILAGVYQLSPLKHVCLNTCRTPTTFIMTRWRDGAAGAVRMGLEHGGYCLGCCWLLFVILFPLGVRNVAAMALITAFIFAEKALPIGHKVSLGGAVVLVGYGALVLLMPDALPTTMT